MRALKSLLALGLAGWMCSYCFFIMVPNLLVANAIPQLPFGNSELAQWQIGIPQNSDGTTGSAGVGAGASRVGRDGYRSADAQPPWGLPLRGPIQKWGTTRSETACTQKARMHADRNSMTQRQREGDDARRSR